MQTTPATTASLKDRDYTILIDQSGSMSYPDPITGKSKWKAAAEGTVALAHKLEELDSDGLTLITFNDTARRLDNVKAATVAATFEENDPFGGTDTAGAIKSALDSYFTRKRAGQTKPNGEIFIVVTDGQPSNRDAVADAIVAATKKLDNDKEIGIQFLQIGDDPDATAFLQFLDDELVSKRGARFDVVNTTTFKQAGQRPLTQLLLDALND